MICGFRIQTWILSGVMLAGFFVGCARQSVELAATDRATAESIPTAPPPAPSPHANYYKSIDRATQEGMRRTLHERIRGHRRQTYAQVWIVLERADENPGDPTRILDLYRNESITKFGGGNGPYNREHTWPKSYGFPNESSLPYTDCHHLFLCNVSYNSSRGNKPYDDCPGGIEKPTVASNGTGGNGTPAGEYPGQSNWTIGSAQSGKWETWIGRRGDVARALLYLDVRYEGGIDPVSNRPEPDLVLTDEMNRIRTGSGNVAYMGRLSTLIRWHHEDPVDDKERRRNDIIEEYQGNRNPFIDHPEWVDCVFEGRCD